MNLKFFSLLLLLCLAVSGVDDGWAEESTRGLNLNVDVERGHLRKEVVIPGGKAALLYQASYALLLGMSDYTNGWPNLPGVKKDIDAVRQVLEDSGFQVIVKMDLNKQELDHAFVDFITQYGQAPENRLLFYFAGHGHTLETGYGGEIGYIVPVDTPNPHQAPANFKKKAMDMQQIEIYAMQIEAKHALFLFDACFSGSLFALSRAVPEVINYKTAKPVRQFITSGSAEESVPDESIFREQFVRAIIKGEADSDKDGYVTGTELGEFLQNTVVNYSRNNQHPQYGKIRHPNLDKGDFVFLLPSQEKAAPEPLPSDSTFSQEALTQAAAAEKARVAWQTKLDEMEGAFSFVSQYEQENISKELKIQAWRRFISAFSEENPYSTRDNDLLTEAARKLREWEEYVVPTPSPKTVFRIEKVVLRDEDGDIIEPEDDVYTLEEDETVTISVNVTHSEGHRVEFAWTTARGKVPPGNRHINTYTAEKTGSDYVLIYVWDAISGDELPEYEINLDVISSDVEFYIDEVLVQDAQGNVIRPYNDIYTIKKGQTVTITVETAEDEEQELEFAWTTGRGRVPVSSTNVNTYTATSTGGDYVIVYAWDSETWEEAPEFPISISVIP